MTLTVPALTRARALDSSRIWCPNCEAVQPLQVGYMDNPKLNDHAATDLLCGICGYVIATLHHYDEPTK